MLFSKRNKITVNSVTLKQFCCI